MAKSNCSKRRSNAPKGKRPGPPTPLIASACWVKSPTSGRGARNSNKRIGRPASPLDAETARSAIAIVEWFIDAQLGVLARGRLETAKKQEDEVLELIESNRQRRGQDFTTARDVHRNRVTPTADGARALLAKMEANGLLLGEDTTPAHGGKTTRVYRAIKNPIPG